MTVTSQALSGATPNWYCTRCRQPFLDTTDEQPCPRCGQDDQIVGNEPEEKKVKVVKTASKPSAMFRRASIERSRTGVERITAWIVLIVSVLGTVVALHGGWEAFRTDPRLLPIIAGVLIQGGLTYVQWAYYHQRSLAWGSRLLDTALTAIGFGPLLVAPLARSFLSVGVTSVFAGMPGAIVAAWATIMLASYGLAWYPESRLVD